jgi:hypothetical protein
MEPLFGPLQIYIFCKQITVIFLHKHKLHRSLGYQTEFLVPQFSMMLILSPHVSGRELRPSCEISKYHSLKSTLREMILSNLS